MQETEDTITLHGLGFVQVKLPVLQRLHVWHPDLPRRRCFRYSQVHDHRFGFVSRVLIGTQINRVFNARPCSLQEPATHMSYLHEGDRTRFGNRPWIPDGGLIVTPADVHQVPAGDCYTMEPYVYHATEPGGDGRVATLMTKTVELERGAHSLCALGIKPDVDFDRRQWPPPVLWEVVRDVLGAG